MEDLDRLIHYGVKGMKWDKDKKKEHDAYASVARDYAKTKEIRDKTSTLPERLKDQIDGKRLTSVSKYIDERFKGDTKARLKMIAKQVNTTNDIKRGKEALAKVTNKKKYTKKEQDTRQKAALFVRNMSKKQEVRRKEQEAWENRSNVQKVIDKLKKKKRPKYLSPLNQ